MSNHVLDNNDSRKEKIINTINHMKKEPLGVPYFTKRPINVKEISSIKIKKNKEILQDSKNSQKISDFLINLKNPSFGNDYLKKRYPEIYPKYKVNKKINFRKLTKII